MIGGRITLSGNNWDYLVWREGSGDTIEIYDIAVASERRRTGIGRQLVGMLLKDYVPPGVRLVWAVTRYTNLIAQEFYEALGFRVVAVLRNFYKDEPDGKNVADAIMFGLDIKLPSG